MIHKLNKTGELCSCGERRSTPIIGVYSYPWTHAIDSNRAEFDRLAVELARKVAATYPGGSCAGLARELLAAAEAVKVINAQ